MTFGSKSNFKSRCEDMVLSVMLVCLKGIRQKEMEMTWGVCSAVSTPSVRTLLAKQYRTLWTLRMSHGDIDCNKEIGRFPS